MEPFQVWLWALCSNIFALGHWFKSLFLGEGEHPSQSTDPPPAGCRKCREMSVRLPGSEGRWAQSLVAWQPRHPGLQAMMRGGGPGALMEPNGA